jgi:hypothetical protein
LSVELDLAFFRSLADCDAANLRVQNRLAKMQSGEDIAVFHPVCGLEWHFANGVAALASLIGDNRGHFQEPGFARAVADRSNYVASFIFDAARDEYDDHINPMRDTHRCMAQASLISMAKFYGLGNEVLDEPDPRALTEVCMGGAFGYRPPSNRCGCGGRNLCWHRIHLGSGVAGRPRVFLIDERAASNDPVHICARSLFSGGGKHRCYAWWACTAGTEAVATISTMRWPVPRPFAVFEGATHANAVAALAPGFVPSPKTIASSFRHGHSSNPWAHKSTKRMAQNEGNVNLEQRSGGEA